MDQVVPTDITGSNPTAPRMAVDRAARTVYGISTVLTKRPDLRGVLATADILDEHIRISA